MKRLLLVVACLFLVGCGSPEPRKAPSYKFQMGQIVESVVTGTRGQIYKRYPCQCKEEDIPLYNVRFDAREIAPAEQESSQAHLALVYDMKEFELKAVTD